MPDLNQLIKEGIFDIELGVANPRTSGVTAGEGAIGYATDNSRWVKVGSNDTDWEQILTSTNGDFVANFELATVAAPQVLPAGVAGILADGQMVIGDGTTAPGVRQSRVIAEYSTSSAFFSSGPQTILSFEAKVGKVYELLARSQSVFDGADSGTLSLFFPNSSLSWSHGYQEKTEILSFSPANLKDNIIGSLNDGDSFTVTKLFQPSSDGTLTVQFTAFPATDFGFGGPTFIQVIER